MLQLVRRKCFSQAIIDLNQNDSAAITEGVVTVGVNSPGSSIACAMNVDNEENGHDRRWPIRNDGEES